MRKITGTYEWARKTANCILGCGHDCKYCYAKSMAIRYGRKTKSSWVDEEARLHQIRNVCRGRPTRVMFPSTHDITPSNLAICLQALDMMLGHGHHLLIVSKPHADCIQSICRKFASDKGKILFRFTIGSADDQILRFWEPNAPGFMERLDALCFAHENGFQTSVSCEPILDDHAEAVVEAARPFVSDSIWLGKANQLRARLKINGAEAETLRRGEELIASQGDERIWELYSCLKDNAKIKWKESIKKVLGLESPKEPGLDV